jgi:hypothetical protein
MDIDELTELESINDTDEFTIIRNGSYYKFSFGTLKSEVVEDG